MSPKVVTWLQKWGPLASVGLLWLGVQFISPGERLTDHERRLSALEGMRGDVDAMALSLCLVETNPIARQRLRCGEREAQAGIRR